ncbi:MAG: TetR/AcrR family transcriptional regulator C-terminal domain-containing protein [Clostridia bacterium]|nr:TetR/AcrR family transcriptional regulator C-terminal domain-containing protein [Clostridia bacterium]
MKRKSAREILAEAFREVAETKSIDKITVKDITTSCGYSQATFYRQFKDKYDLIAWDYAQSVSSIMDRIGPDGLTWNMLLVEFAEHYDRDRAYLANLLQHTGGQDSFIQYMSDINYRAMLSLIQNVSGMEELPENTVMYIRFYCLGSVCLTCEWILGKYRASPRELADVFLRTLPAPLQTYLEGK